MKALEPFYDPADMSVCVDAGMTLGELEKKVRADGLRFPLGLASGWTVADLILRRRLVATSLRFGSVADNVLGMLWELPDGKTLQLGSRVVKNVAGFDLVRFLTHSRGRLGKPALVALRLRPLGDRHEGIEARGSLDQLATLQRKILSSSWVHVVDACLLVFRPQGPFLWTPYNADKAQAGLIRAWLETTAKDLGLETLCREGKPPKTLNDYSVQAQTRPSLAGPLASRLVQEFGGRALAMGGLGAVEYAPDKPLEGELLETLHDIRQELQADGGHLLMEGEEEVHRGVEAEWEKQLTQLWGRLQ